MDIKRRSLLAAVPTMLASTSGCVGPLLGATQTWHRDETEFSPPVVQNQTVFAGGIDGRVYAFRASDGAVRWATDIGDPMVSFYRAAVRNGTLYIGDTDGYLHALSTADGTRQWQTQLRSGCCYGPVVVAGTVFVGGNEPHGAVAVTADDGTVEQRFAGATDTTMPPAVTADSVYVGDLSGVVTAFDRDSGDQRWQVSVSAAEIWTRPAIWNETVFVGDLNGRLHALDTMDGRSRWQFETDGSIYSSPVVHDGTVYIGSTDRHLYAVSASNGEERWHTATDDGVATPPVAADNHVYVGDSRGWVYGMTTTEGKTTWRANVNSSVLMMEAGKVDTIVVALPVGVDNNHVYVAHAGGLSVYER